MSKIKSQIKDIIDQRFGGKYQVKSVTEIPGGFRSKAYRITVKHKGKPIKFFLKHTLHDLPGFYEDNIEKLSSYLISQRTAELARLSPKSLGVFLSQQGKIINLSDFREDDTVFQLQQYQSGSNYLTDLLAKEKRADFLADNKRIIDRIVRKLVGIHGQKLNLTMEKKKLLYKKSLRNSIVNPELALTMIEDNIEGSLFAGRLRLDYISEMLKLAESFWPDYKRLAVIHGDFWPGNIILHGKNVTFFDYSRYLYGDAGVDVGHFYLALIFFSIWRKDKRYVELANYFLKDYEQRSGDKKIKETAVLAFGPVGVVLILDKFFPGLTKRQRKNFAAYVMSCLKKKRIIFNYDFNK